MFGNLNELPKTAVKASRFLSAVSRQGLFLRSKKPKKQKGGFRTALMLKKLK